MSRVKGSKFLQYFAAMAGNLSAMSVAVMMGWASPMLKKLAQNDPLAGDNPLGHAITPEESSWIGGLPVLGAIAGCFYFAYSAKRWGRKKTMLSGALPLAISWILIGLATSVEVLYISRFIAGISMGASLSLVPMYSIEIAETSIRGILGTFLQLFMNIGWLFSFCIGPYVSYNTFWIACSIIPIVFFVSFSFMPESPYYLASKGKNDEIISVLIRLRGKSADAVKSEAEEIQRVVEETSKCNAKFMDLFRVRSNCKALLLSFSIFTFQIMSGASVVLTYAETIFDAAGTNNYISSAVSTIIIGIVQLIACCVASLLVDRMGRKILLILSGIFETISLTTLGLYFFLKQQADQGNGDINNIGWLPVTSLIIFISSYNFGWGPLSWTIIGELFIPDVKPKALGFTTFFYAVIAFSVTKFFTNIVDLMGLHGAFWGFAVFCLASIFFTIFLLPETKGKTLQEIQAELGGNSESQIHQTNSTEKIMHEKKKENHSLI